MAPRCLYVGMKDLVRDRVSYANSRIVRSFSIVGAFVRGICLMDGCLLALCCCRFSVELLPIGCKRS